MAIGTIITCTGPEDLYRRAEDLLEHGIHTVFIARNTLKVVSIQGVNNVSNKMKVESKKQTIRIA